jgi:hypothetical protein
LESILLVALLLPIIYLMQIIKMKQIIRMKHVYVTVIVSTIDVTISTLILNMVKDYNTSYFIVLLSGIIVGVVWALLLCGCYYCYQVLTNRR